MKQKPKPDSIESAQRRWIERERMQSLVPVKPLWTDDTEDDEVSASEDAAT
jgi:hypothetical protein